MWESNNGHRTSQIESRFRGTTSSRAGAARSHEAPRGQSGSLAAQLLPHRAPAHLVQGKERHAPHVKQRCAAPPLLQAQSDRSKRQSRKAPFQARIRSTSGVCLLVRGQGEEIPESG